MAVSQDTSRRTLVASVGSDETSLQGCDENLQDITKHLDDIVKLSHHVYSTKRQTTSKQFHHIQSLVNNVKNIIINNLIPLALRAQSSIRGTDMLPAQPTEHHKKTENMPITINSMASQNPPVVMPRETYARVVIKSNGDKLPSPPQLENSISRILKEKNIDATIQGCHPVKNKDLMLVNFGTNDNVNLIADSISSNLGFSASGTPPIHPKLTISHIPQHIDEEDIKKEIFSSNPCLQGLNEDDFVILFSYIHKDFRSVVCKVSPTIRKAICANDRKLRIGFRCCPAKDRIHVIRCTKCNRFGHTRKYCNADKETCSFCSQQHRTHDCPNKQDEAKYQCSNCCHFNNPELDITKHAAHDPRCPTFQQQRKRTILRTNWGNNDIPQF